MASDSQNQTPSFEYFFSHKGNYLVVTFVGPMDLNSVEKLTRCREELKNFKSVQKTVFYFRDVQLISGEAIAILTHMQMETRNRQSELKICSLAPPLREKLQKMGVIRAIEVSDNLVEALKAGSIKQTPS